MPRRVVLRSPCCHREDARCTASRFRAAGRRHQPRLAWTPGALPGRDSWATRIPVQPAAPASRTKALEELVRDLGCAHGQKSRGRSLRRRRLLNAPLTIRCHEQLFFRNLRDRPVPIGRWITAGGQLGSFTFRKATGAVGGRSSRPTPPRGGASAGLTTQRWPTTCRSARPRCRVSQLSATQALKAEEATQESVGRSRKLPEQSRGFAT